MSRSLSNALYRASSTTRFIPPSLHLSLPPKNAYRELFCISSILCFLFKKKKVGFETRGLGSALRKSRSVQNSFAPRCPSVIFFFFFFYCTRWGREAPGMFETRGFSSRASGALAGPGMALLEPFPRPARCPQAHVQRRARYFACLMRLHITSDTNITDNSVPRSATENLEAKSTPPSLSTVRLFNSGVSVDGRLCS